MKIMTQEELDKLTPDEKDAQLKAFYDLSGQIDDIYLFEPKRKNGFLDYDFFEHRILPLTKDAVERYIKLANVKRPELIERLKQDKRNAFMPDGVFHRLKTFNEAKCSIEEWYVMHAGRILCLLIYHCAMYIRANKVGKLTAPEIAEWDKNYVDFAITLLALDKHKRKKPGKATAQKRKPLKDWCIVRALELHKLRSSYSKAQIAQKLLEEMDASKDKWIAQGCVLLTGNNGLNTLKNDWLPKGKPDKWS